MRALTAKVQDLIGRVGFWSMNIVLALSILLVGLLDFATGYEIDISFLYLALVSLGAWYGSGPMVFVFATLSAAVEQLANDLAGEPHSNIIIPLWNDVVQALIYLSVASLIRQLRTLLNQARRASKQDFLTGLINRRALVERMDAELSRAARNRNPVVVGFIDLDHFKKVNDELGHSEGDRLLFEVSKVLNSALRRSDVIARVGGDEFAIVLPDCDESAAHAVGRKIVRKLEELSKANGWPVTASVGLILVKNPQRDENIEALLQLADHLMYRVKERGRNSYLLDAKL